MNLPGEQGVMLWGWDDTNKVWVPVLVNAAGKLIIDPSEILEDTPTDGEVAKAPTSNWAHDHADLPDVHHAKQHASQHLGAGNDLLSWTDEKLLKGAGAGVAPDEIDVPTGSTIILKTVTELVTNINLQNDNELFFSVAANEVLALLVHLEIMAATTVDFKYRFTLPALATMGKSNVWVNITSIVDATVSETVGTSGSKQWMHFYCVYVGGANAGTVQLQWAAATSDGNVRVYLNSYIQVQKLG